MSTDAYRLLRHEILHGALMPGDRLRIAELNQRYRLGLTPIREALMRLASEGLVSWQSHRGASVASIDVEELRDLVRTRREIGWLCLTRAIELGDATWEAEILRAFHMLKRTPRPNHSDGTEAVVAWESLHREFHNALIAACASPWLLRFWNTLSDQSERYRKVQQVHSGIGKAAARELDREHEEIMEAVLARDATVATERLNEHLGRIEEEVASFIEPGEK